ncbi:MAG: hypothetical protein AAF514_08825 [Verrucomicrobiota bacterium]
MKPLVVLVILFVLVGCERRALRKEERAGNFVIAWLEENELQGDYPSLNWRVEKNKGQHGIGWDCEHVFFRKSKDLTGTETIQLQSILNKEAWRDWAIIDNKNVPNRDDSIWFFVSCPFTSRMQWRIEVVKQDDIFEISDVLLWNNKADQLLTLEPPP